MSNTTQGSSPRVSARGEGSRARLLDAALRSFAVKGFHATSTRDLADAAELSPGAVYMHYRSKEELLYVLSLSGHTDVRDLLRGALAQAEEPVEQLRLVVFAFAKWHAEFHTRARVVQYELGALDAAHHEEIAVLRRESQGMVRELIERGVRSGDFDVPDAVGTARAVVSLGIDVARWYRPEGPLTPDDIGQQHAGLALRMVGSRPDEC